MLLFGNFCLKCVSLPRMKQRCDATVPISECFCSNSKTFLLQDSESASSVSGRLLPGAESQSETETYA